MDNQIQEEIVQEEVVQEQEPIVEQDGSTNEMAETSEEHQSEEVTLDYSEFLKGLGLKHNHEPKELESVDELRALAQKGMNYDKIQAKLEEAENDPMKKWGYDWFKEAGFDTPEEFLTAAANEKEKREIDKLVQKNVPPEYAKEMLESRKFREKAEFETKERQENESKVREWDDFTKRFPGIDANKIPDEVFVLTSEGRSLGDAYALYDYSQLKEKVKSAEKSEENQTASTGSVTGKGNTGTVNYTKEQVQAMTTDEVKNNYAAIIESKKNW